MDTSQRQPASGTGPTDAVSLIRALVGVQSVRIDSDEHGVQAVHVTANRENVDGLAAKIRSALLAGLATPVVPGRIHVRGPDADEAASVEAPDESARNGRQNESQGTTPPYIVALDTERDADGRVVYRVSVAVHTRVHRAEVVADTADDPMEVAAEAAVRALDGAGLHGLELHGLRRLTIGGRQQVIVGLRRPPGTHSQLRFGSAPIVGSVERTAAEATVTAASYMD